AVAGRGRAGGDQERQGISVRPGPRVRRWEGGGDDRRGGAERRDDGGDLGGVVRADRPLADARGDGAFARSRRSM
ncbi:MAG: hypothetical protein AVDCRST_MAG19-153, partial [uncultured Thermomicrobiales bacterium]